MSLCSVLQHHLRSKTLIITLFTMLSRMTHCKTTPDTDCHYAAHHYAGCHYAERCSTFWGCMGQIVETFPFMMSVILLSVIVLSVSAPFNVQDSQHDTIHSSHQNDTQQSNTRYWLSLCCTSLCWLSSCRVLWHPLRPFETESLSVEGFIAVFH